MMSHKKLILQAFEKAEREELKKGNKNPSKTAMATAISDAISENAHFKFGEKRLRDYYNEALKNEKEDIRIAQLDVINALLNYLEFNSYEDFIRSLKKDEVAPFVNIEKEQTTKPLFIKSWLIKHKGNLLIGLLGISLMIIVSVFVFKEEQQWMIWEKDHYEEADFSEDLLSAGKLKIYKEDRILKFKKLEPNCTIQFFNPDGNVKTWYGKNPEGTLEIFTTLGLHPETGKALKPITPYIVTKYFCKD